eukprot:gene18282-25726_t
MPPDEQQVTTTAVFCCGSSDYRAAFFEPILTTLQPTEGVCTKFKCIWCMKTGKADKNNSYSQPLLKGYTNLIINHIKSVHGVAESNKKLQEHLDAKVRAKIVDRMYMDVLYIVPTSNRVEKLFSRATLNLTDHRKSMFPKHLELLMYYLRANRDMWDAFTVNEAVGMKDEDFPEEPELLEDLLDDLTMDASSFTLC